MEETELLCVECGGSLSSSDGVASDYVLLSRTGGHYSHDGGSGGDYSRSRALARSHTAAMEPLTSHPLEFSVAGGSVIHVSHKGLSDQLKRSINLRARAYKRSGSGGVENPTVPLIGVDLEARGRSISELERSIGESEGGVEAEGISSCLCTDCYRASEQLLARELDRAEKESATLRCFLEEEEEEVEKGQCVASLTGDDRLCNQPGKTVVEVPNRDRDAFRHDLENLERESKTLALMEEELWLELLQLQLETFDHEDDYAALIYRSQSAVARRDALINMRVLESLFTLAISDARASSSPSFDHLPSINGYRLARRAHPPELEWQEIEASWAEAVLLLLCCSNALGHTSTRWRLVPVCPASRIIELGKNGREEAHHVFSFSDSITGKQKAEDVAIDSFVRCTSDFLSIISDRQLGSSPPPHDQRGSSLNGIHVGLLRSDSEWRRWLLWLSENLNWILLTVSRDMG